ncbi:MAG: GAF domain-containing protein [Chloroflexi bacterium]|nr:GAF domain-containing protein [Chloroflexota bacterium]
MSKRSKSEQFLNRLESLFDEIEETAAPAPRAIAADAVTNGWVWECDAAGRFTSVSPEVKKHLGLAARAVIGQPLAEFGLEKAARQRVRKALKAGEFPAQLQVAMLARNGKPVTVTLHIFALPEENGRAGGYHGFAEVLASPVGVATAPAATAAPAPAAPAARKAKSAKPARAEPETRQKPEPKAGKKAAVRKAAPKARPARAKKAAARRAAPPAKPLSPEVFPAPLAGTAAPEPSAEIAEPAPQMDVEAVSAAIEPPQLETVPPLPAAAEPAPAMGAASASAVPEPSEAATAPEDREPSALSERPGVHRPTPMAFQTDPDGLLDLIDDDPGRVWTEDERLLVRQVADQLALALENANLFQQTQQALAETDTLYQASAEFNAAANYTEVLETLLRHTLLGQQTNHVAINIFDTPWNDPNDPPAWFETIQRWNPQDGLTGETRRLRFIVQNLLQRNDFVFIQDINADPRVSSALRPFFTVERSARSLVFIPIDSGTDWLGFIEAFFTARQEFTEDQVRRLTSVAGQATEKITSLYLNSRIVRRRTNADRLNTLARQMAELLSEQELRRFMLAQIFEYLQPDQISLYEWQSESHSLRLVERTLASPNDAEDDYQLEQEIPLAGRAELERVLSSRAAKYETAVWQRGLIREHYCLPWIIGEQTRGLIEIFHTARGAVISDLDQEYIEGITLQAAAAMERARLFEQTQAALSLTDEQARRLRILNELSAQLATAPTLQEVYDFTIQRTHEIFPSERVSLTLLTENRDHVEVVAVLGGQGQLEPGTRLPLAGTANENVVNENRIVVNPDTGQAERGAVRSYIVGPLAVSGEVIGTLNVGSLRPQNFDTRDRDILQQLLSMVGAVVENRRLFEGIQEALAATEEQARRLGRLNQMSSQLGQSADIEAMYRVAVERAREIFTADRASLCLRIPDPFNLLVAAASGAVASTLPGSTLRVQGAFERALHENAIVINQELVAADDTTAIQTTMIAPLSTGGEIFGTLNLGSLRQGAFTARDQEFMIQVASVVSSALENRRLFSQIQRRSQQLEASAEVSRVASTILDITQLLPQVVNLIENGFDLYYCGLFLVDQTGEWTSEPNRWAVLQAGTGDAGRQMLTNGHKLEIGGASMVGAAVSTGQARIALDVGAEAVFFRNPYLPDTRSEMALPLISRGLVLGALTIQSDREGAFTQEDITSLQTMADLIANIIENTRLFSQAQERAAELAILNEMARAYTESLDIDSVVEATYKYTGRLMDAENFYFGLYHAEENEIEFKLFTEDGQRIPPPEERFKLGAGLTDHIVRTRAPLLIEENVEAFLGGLGLAPRGRPALCWLGVPLLRGAEVLGVIAVQSYTAPRLYNQHHVELLSSVANQATVAVNNARLFQQTQARARREALLREITARVHSSADPDAILRTAVREVGSALGRDAFIQLQARLEESSAPGAVIQPVRPGAASPPGNSDAAEKENGQ